MGKRYVWKRRFAGRTSFDRRESAWKRTLVLGGLCAALLALALFFLWMGREGELGYSSDYVAMAELPSQLSFTYYEEEEWKGVIEGINGGDLGGKLTYGKLRKLLDCLSIRDYVGYEDGFFWQNVTRPQWNSVYEQALDLLDTDHKVSAKNLVFLTKDGAAGSGSKKLTQKGYYDVSEGVDYFHYYDMYQVYAMDGRIIGVSSECQARLTFQNVFVHKAGDGMAEILYEGEKISLDMEGLTEEIADTICDIEWKDGNVAAIYKKEDVISGKVLSFDEEQIEISGYGKLRHNGSLKVYKTYGTVEELDESKLVIGNLQADFVVAGKKVCGIILKEPLAIEKIRVLLLNGENGTYHADPIFAVDTDCVVAAGGKETQVGAGQPIAASKFLKKKGTDYVKISPEQPEGRIYFADADGAHTSLGYRGTIEIRKYKEGYGVVNEVSLEEYLYGVVPSEMPASYETEALRAQAVCARSYACIQLMKGDYAALGAHVDDSTNYQVYRKQEEDPKASLAVDDTVGEVVKYQGEVAETYYFSTSCGCTEDVGIWNLEDGGEYGYLAGTSLMPGNEEVDLSDEEAFAKFIQDKDVAAYDSGSVYFRWRAELGMEEKADALNAAVLARAEADADDVRFYKADGTEASKGDFAGFGAFERLLVEKRDAGGAICALRMSYEKGSVVLATEYNIRSVLGAAVTGLSDKNGEPCEMAILPSACFAAIPVESGYVLYGGGCGHGLGMSQNGANGMAKAGMGYVDILMKFYQGIEIENVYGKE